MTITAPDTFGPYTSTHASDNSISAGRFAAQTYMRIGGFGFTIGAEASNAIDVSVQAYDIRGRKWNGYVAFDLIFSTASFGAADAIFDDLGISVGTLINEYVADAAIRIQSNAAGLVTVGITKVGVYSCYVRALCGDRMTGYTTAIAFV